MFMAIMDITIVNVTLPQLATDFGVAPDHIDGVVVGVPGEPRGVHPGVRLAR